MVEKQINRNTNHCKHYGRVYGATCSTPKQFSSNYLFNADWRCDDGVKGFLVIHSHKRAVSAFKKAAIH